MPRKVQKGELKNSAANLVDLSGAYLLGSRQSFNYEFQISNYEL